MLTEIASTFIMVAHMTLASGVEVMAYGEQYADLAVCRREAAQQAAAMNTEIRQAMHTTQHPVFRAVRMECEDLTDLEKSGAVARGEFDE